MNKKILLLSTILLTLFSCGLVVAPGPTPNNSENTTVNTTVNTTAGNVEGSELLEYDDIPQYYENAIRPMGHEAPDPFVMRFNGKYYLFVTTTNGRIRGFQSSDLYTWEYVNNGTCPEGYVYDTNYDNGTSPLGDLDVYAPEVRYYNGKFYLIAASPSQKHNIFEATSPEGPYKTIARNIDAGVIDGSYFITSDENLYVYASGGNGIQARKMNMDFKSFNGSYSSLSSLKTGGWTEGPYYLQRYGKGYFTYCGSHFLSDNYRVEYAYVDEGVTNLNSNSSFERQGSVVLSTENRFYGLGHSSTVLGPDLDSYYIAYHNLTANGLRPFNLSKLQFNGSRMVADGIHADLHNGVSADLYVESGDEFELDGDYLLSGVEHGDSFTVEYNTVGQGKMIFSYVDEFNYAYLEFRNNKITIADVIDGSTKIVEEVSLVRTYSTDVIHTFRFQHKDGTYALYFDDIEKVYDGSYTFGTGQIGYEADTTFSQTHYTAFSNVAMGSSDEKFYAEDISLANAYDTKLSILNDGSGLVNAGNSSNRFITKDADYMVLDNIDDRATYRFYALEADYYYICARVSADSRGKSIGVRIDDGDIIECPIPSDAPTDANGDVYVTLAAEEIWDGQHNISIYNVGDKVKFSEIHYENSTTGSDFEETFRSSSFENSFDTFGDVTSSSSGLNTNSVNKGAALTTEKYREGMLSLDFKVNNYNSGYLALLLNTNNFSFNITSGDAQASYLDLYQGYRLKLNSNSIVVDYVDYNTATVNVKTISGLSLGAGSQHNVGVEIINNSFRISVDGNEVGTVNCNIGYLFGKVGIFSNKTNSVISSLSFENYY